MGDAQSREVITLLEPHVCATQHARIGGEALVLSVRNETWTLRDEGFISCPVKFPSGRTAWHRGVAKISFAAVLVRHSLPAEEDGVVVAVEVRFSLFQEVLIKPSHCV